MKNPLHPAISVVRVQTMVGDLEILQEMIDATIDFSLEIPTGVPGPIIGGRMKNRDFEQPVVARHPTFHQAVILGSSAPLREELGVQDIIDIMLSKLYIRIRRCAREG